MQLGLFDSAPRINSQIVRKLESGPRPSGRPLRDYQQACVAGIHEQLHEYRSTLVVAATGAGKTTIFSYFAHHWPERDYAKELSDRVLIIAHRDELTSQARTRIAQDTGEYVGLEKAESRSGRERIVVASIQTLYTEERLHHWKPDSFGLVIYDEAHHAPSPKNKAVVDYFSAAKVVGFTATPDRADEKAMGRVFESEPPAFVYEIDDAINDGWLVEPRVLPLYLGELDLSACRTTAGDLNQGDLDAAMVESVIAHMVKATIAECGDLKTLLFTTSVDNATRAAELCNEMKAGSARSVNGKTPLDIRRQTLAAFERGDFQYLPNVGIATEGFDCPPVAVISQGRPTKSRALHTQIVGRGLRPLFPFGFDPHAATSDERKAAIARSSKPYCLVLEFTGNTGRHSLACTVDILGGKYDDDEVALAKKKIAGGANMPAEALADARKEIAEARRNANARRLLVAARPNYTKGEIINPFAVLHMKRDKRDEWGDRFGGAVPTEAQMWYLGSRKVDIPKDFTKAKASKLIVELKARAADGKANYNQTKKLERYGVNTENLSYEKACQLMCLLADNHDAFPSAAAVDAIVNRERQAGE